MSWIRWAKFPSSSSARCGLRRNKALFGRRVEFVAEALDVLAPDFLDEAARLGGVVGAVVAVRRAVQVRQPGPDPHGPAHEPEVLRQALEPADEIDQRA